MGTAVRAFLYVPKSGKNPSPSSQHPFPSLPLCCQECLPSPLVPLPASPPLFIPLSTGRKDLHIAAADPAAPVCSGGGCRERMHGELGSAGDSAGDGWAPPPCTCYPYPGRPRRKGELACQPHCFFCPEPSLAPQSAHWSGAGVIRRSPSPGAARDSGSSEQWRGDGRGGEVPLSTEGKGGRAETGGFCNALGTSESPTCCSHGTA